MAKKINVPVPIGPDGVIVGSNGVHIDPITKRFVKGGKPVTAIATTSQASELAHLRHDRKRAVVQAAANEAVERDDWRITHGDMAFVAAIANTAMLKATTPDDPKAIEAARFLLRESGLSQESDVEGKQANESVLAALGREAIAHLIARAQEQRLSINAE